MKTKNFKRLMAVSIAAIMSAALFACGSNQTQVSNEAGSTAGTATQASTATEAGTAAIDKSPITLTIGMPLQNCTLGDGIHQECSVLKEITAQTGITLSFVTYDNNKFKVLSAGGDLPDLISISGDDTIAGSLIESGALLQLDDLLDNYGQNIKNNIHIALRWSKNVIGKGKTYLLPVCTSIENTTSPIVSAGATFNTRYDIYKAIG